MAGFHLVASVVVLLQVLLFKRILCGPIETGKKLSAEQIVFLRQIGEALKENINAEVNPCVDYHSYVCSNYNASAKESSTVGDPIRSFSDFQTYYTERIASKFEIKWPGVLQSCQNEAEQEFGQFMRSFDFVDSIGGWPVTDSNWTGKEFDVLGAIAEMNSYLIPVMLNVTFVEEESTMRRYFSVNPVEDPVLNDESSKEGLIRLLERHHFNNARQVVNEGAQFEDTFLKLVSHMQPVGSREGVIETDYRGLKERIPEINWDKLCNATFGRIMNDTYPIVIRDPKTIRNMFRFVLVMQPRLVANYFLCRLTAGSFSVIKRLSDDSDCGHNRYWFSAGAFLSQVLNIILSDKDNMAQHPLVDMLQSTASVLNETLGIFGSSTLEDISREIQSFSLDHHFIDLQMEANKNQTILRNELYITRETTRRLAGYFLDDVKDKLKLASFKIVPSVFIFGVFGPNLPSANVFKIFTEDFVSLIVLMIKESSDFTNSTRNCFQQQIGLERIENRHLLHALTTQIYFKAYFEWADSHKDIIRAEDEILLEYGLTNRELILEDYMRSSCEDEKSLASVYLQNLKEFSDVYNCPIGSPMNPVKKCETL